MMRELPSENLAEAAARAHGQIVPAPQELLAVALEVHLAGLRLFKALFRGPRYFLVEDHAAEAILVKVVALVHGGILKASSWRGEVKRGNELPAQRAEMSPQIKEWKL